ncbi:hypothetical protein [Sphingomonas sp. CFBP 8760]|uniref:hypothetical protein n=1 Tax=Sphingomonas sp. CFBP 8760 TaxID=2775282 RepID=UPI001FCE92BD|nr:hypothetical protein [Sphingomonas sp. CFBP 8760]
MMKGRPEPSQSFQRIKVGLIGLIAVVVLIATASTIIASATHERAVGGSAQANLVAEIAASNDMVPETGEPLAEMGVAPSSANVQDAAPPR